MDDNKTIKTNTGIYEIAYQDVLKWVTKHSKVRLIVSNIDLNYNACSFNCN